MKILHFLRVVCLAVVAAAPIVWVQFGADPFTDLVRYTSGSPHDRYAVALKWGKQGGTTSAQQWLASAETAIGSAETLAKLPATRAIDFATGDRAAAYAVTLKRGQRYIVDASRAGVFVDLFERGESGARRVAHAPEGSVTMAFEADRDGTYVVRLQPALDVVPETLALEMRTEPTLRVPVQEASRRNIGSGYGDARDGGRRDHHGVDIFAKRGTPVVAAAGGIVTRVGTNGLGGKVVWISRPFHGESHYYAHLDEQLVTVGTRVEEGDVIGRVGNTGNARSTPPHLHFGIYASGGAVDPLPYIADL